MKNNLYTLCIRSIKLKPCRQPPFLQFINKVNITITFHQFTEKVKITTILKSKDQLHLIYVGKVYTEHYLCCNYTNVQCLGNVSDTHECFFTD